MGDNMAVDISTFGVEFKTDGLIKGQRALKDTETAANRTATSADKLGGRFTALEGAVNTARNAIAGYLTLRTAQVFLQAADSVALLDARLKLAAGSSEAFVQAQRDVYKIAQQNGLGLQEVATLYSRLAEPVRRLGGSTRETQSIVDAFAKTLRISGASTQEASAATLQFAQAMGSGKLQGDEFRSMAEASPRFMKALADGMGVPIEKLKEMGSEGRLTADVVGNALIKSLDQLKTEAASLPDTLGIAFTRFRNEALLTVSEINRVSGATVNVAQAMDFGAAYAKELTNTMKLLGGSSKSGADDFDLMTFAASALGIAFETVIVIASDVWHVLKTMGVEIGGIGAQIAAVLRGDFGQVAAIREEMIADGQKAAADLKVFQDRVAGMTKRTLEQRRMLQNASPAQRNRSTRDAADALGASTILRSTVTPGADKGAARAAENELKKQQALLNNLAGLDSDYQEQLTRLYAIKQKGNITEAQYVALVTELINKQPGIKKALEDQIDLNRKLFEEQQKIADERAAAFVAEDKAREAGRTAVQEYAQAIDDQNKLTMFELTLVGKTAAAKRLALEQYQIELDLKKQILAIDSNTGFDQAQRDEQISVAKRAANNAMYGALRRSDLSSQNEAQQLSDDFSKTLHDDVKGALSNAFRDSKNPAMAFVDGLANVLYTRMTNSLANSLADALVGNGKSGGGGGLVGAGLDWLSTMAFTAGGTRGMSWEFPKANGGYAPPNSLQVVNENGPELLDMGGRQVLKMGSKGGTVIPNGGGGMSINYAPVIQVDARSDRAQVQADVARLLERNNRGLVAMLERRETHT